MNATILKPLRAALLITGALFALVMSSCSGDEPDNPDAEKARTVLIYMVADNSLGGPRLGADETNLAAMETAAAQGALGTGRLVVYHDPLGRGGCTLYDITPQGRKPLREYDESVSSLSPERMRQVLADVEGLEPDNSCGLVLWSHGTGWIDTSRSRSAIGSKPGAVAQSFGEDQSPSTTEMSVPTLAEALRGRTFDFIYFDCCFMECVEVVYELRSLTPWIIGSATELPIEGMPYIANVGPMLSLDFDPCLVARNTLTYYTENYDPVYRPGCTMAVVKTEALDALAGATADVMRSGAAADPLGQMPMFRSGGPRSYTWDMACYITSMQPDASLLAAWRKAYSEAVVMAGSTPLVYGLDMTGFSGLGCNAAITAADVSHSGYRRTAWWADVMSASPILNQ